MIQRKQSVFLLLAFIASVVCLCLPLGSFEPQAMGVGFKMYNLMVMLGTGADYSVCGLFGVLVLSSILSAATIGLYKTACFRVVFVPATFSCLWHGILCLAQ